MYPPQKIPKLTYHSTKANAKKPQINNAFSTNLS